MNYEQIKQKYTDEIIKNLRDLCDVMEKLGTHHGHMFYFDIRKLLKRHRYSIYNNLIEHDVYV